MRRLVALLLVALGLAPGTWWRSPLPPANDAPVVMFTPIAVPGAELGPLALAGAWRLSSANRHFGSYSALLALDDGTLLAASDRGRMLRFSPPGGPRFPARVDFFAGREQSEKRMADLEALTRDRESGRIWAAYEVTNRIERYDRAFRARASVSPKAMDGWRSALGAEAMVRLADGRFIVLAEGSARWFGSAMPGLLFPSDPVAGASPAQFSFIPPEGFRPVDLAQLPDRRVLILLRKVDWRLPPAFSGKLMLADPAMILAGEPWRAEPVADLVAPLPTDNYEGLAVEPDGRGGAVLWLISDDNEMTLQRTLLLKLTWPGKAKARGIIRAPR
jgi:hypothetical protein